MTRRRPRRPQTNSSFSSPSSTNLCCCLALFVGLLLVRPGSTTQQATASSLWNHRTSLSKRFDSPASTPAPPLLAVRGGSSYYGGENDDDNNNNYNAPPAPPDEDAYYVPPSQPQYGATNEDGSIPQFFEEPPSTSFQDEVNDDPFPETVQDRVDHWRANLQQHATEMQESPRDEQGRVKLLTSVGKGSRAMIFFLLMWRDIYLYETASQITSNTMRTLLSAPLAFLFVFNLAGAVVSLTTPSHASKKRLKAILNLDKLVEILLVGWALFRLTLWPAQYTPRETYIASILHSFVFFMQAQAFTRLSWDDKSAQPLSSFAPPRRAATTAPPQQLPPQQPFNSEKDDWYEYQRQQRQGF